MTSLITSLVEKWRDTLDPAVGLLLEAYATSQAQPLEDLLAAVKLEPATTVWGKAGQRKMFEPALNAVLANRSRSFAWKVVR